MKRKLNKYGLIEEVDGLPAFHSIFLTEQTNYLCDAIDRINNNDLENAQQMLVQSAEALSDWIEKYSIDNAYFVNKTRRALLFNLSAVSRALQERQMPHEAIH